VRSVRGRRPMRLLLLRNKRHRFLHGLFSAGRDGSLEVTIAEFGTCLGVLHECKWLAHQPEFK
jgi:hypothetical protein